MEGFGGKKGVEKYFSQNIIKGKIAERKEGRSRQEAVGRIRRVPELTS